MSLIVIFTLVVILLTATTIGVMTTRDARDRARVKDSIRRAFTVRMTAYRGQQCTPTGTAFECLTQSMIGSRGR